MAIEKRFIHFKKFSDFNSKKLSANEANTQYTVGVSGEIQTGSPDILYQSYVWIKDTQQQWTHGQLYDCSGGNSGEENVQSDWLENTSTDAYIKNRTHYISGTKITSPGTYPVSGSQIYFEGKIYNLEVGVMTTLRNRPDVYATLNTDATLTIRDLQSYTETHPIVAVTSITQLDDAFISDNIARTEDFNNVARLDGGHVVANGLVSNEDVYYHLPDTNISDTAHTLATKADLSLYIIQSCTLQDLYDGNVDTIQDNLLEEVSKGKIIGIKSGMNSFKNDLVIANSAVYEDLLYLNFYDAHNGKIILLEYVYTDGAINTYIDDLDQYSLVTLLNEVQASVNGGINIAKGFIEDSTLKYALPTSSVGTEDDVIATRDSLKTINGESIFGSGNIELTSKDVYVLPFNAGAIMTSMDDGGAIYYIEGTTADIDQAIEDKKIFLIPDDNYFSVVQYFHRNVTNTYEFYCIIDGRMCKGTIYVSTDGKFVNSVSAVSLYNINTVGSYNSLTDKPTIPDEVTEDTVANWGFTKNAGTLTSITVNGSTVTRHTNGRIDIGNFQEPLVSGTNIVTARGNSILQQGDLFNTTIISTNVSATLPVSTGNCYMYSVAQTTPKTFQLTWSGNIYNDTITIIIITYSTITFTTNSTYPILWANGTIPTFEAGTLYEISFRQSTRGWMGVAVPFTSEK